MSSGCGVWRGMGCPLRRGRQEQQRVAACGSNCGSVRMDDCVISTKLNLVYHYARCILAITVVFAKKKSRRLKLLAFDE
jgi:hypothetical protein